MVEPSRLLLDFRWAWEHQRIERGATRGQNIAVKLLQNDPVKFAAQLERMEREHAERVAAADPQEASEAVSEDDGEVRVEEMLDRLLGTDRERVLWERLRGKYGPA